MKVYERITGASGATISDCGLYRYSIWRCWDESLPPMVAILCNPSKANATDDDPSLRKGRGFAQRLGFGGLCWVNLYDLRATDPEELKYAPEPIGPLHEAAVDAALQLASLWWGMLAAWGGAARDNGPNYGEQVKWFRSRAAIARVPLFALKVAKDGVTPCHPLMLPYALIPLHWNPAGSH